MRTTLDIDGDVLQTVKELARTEGKSAGRVLSDLARTALTSPTEIAETTGPAGAVLKKGWYVLPKRGGGIVTKELVDRILEEADLEDAGIIKSD
jgi:hypothetical protein